MNEWITQALLGLLRFGPIPQHVAFIMDGNRRFARKTLNTKVVEGHKAGFDTFREVCHVCRRLSVEFVSVYAFALGNFFREEDEVFELHNLAYAKFNSHSDLPDLMRELGIRVIVCGARMFLDEKFQNGIRALENSSKENEGMTLIIYFAYGTRFELSRIPQLIISQTETKNYFFGSTIDQKDDTNLDESTTARKQGNYVNRLTKSNISSFFYASKVASPDLLIRTSGESRLSDFLTYQVSETTVLIFVEKLWPELTVFNLILVFLQYQIISLFLKLRAFVSYL